MSAETAAVRGAPVAAGNVPVAATDEQLDHPRPKATCRCGHDRNHHMVSASPRYSFPGWCAILIGVSWPPQSVSFTCRRCDGTLETITDPEEIKKLRV